ncbi:TPA: hypothetical protein ACOVJJ_004446 [Klebsiella oxytoca]
MSVMPSDFLKSALSFSDDSNEMSIRNKVSRAYYSGYLNARCWQVKSGDKIPESLSGGVHMRLIRFYQKGLCSDMAQEEQQNLAGLLSLAKSLRTKADYKLSLNVPASDGHTAVRCAEKISVILGN